MHIPRTGPHCIRSAVEANWTELTCIVYVMRHDPWMLCSDLAGPQLFQQKCWEVIMMVTFTVLCPISKRNIKIWLYVGAAVLRSHVAHLLVRLSLLLLLELTLGIPSSTSLLVSLPIFTSFSFLSSHLALLASLSFLFFLNYLLHSITI